MTNDERKELQDRVEAKKHQLKSRIAELKADGREQARQEQQQLQKRLDEAQQIVKDKWDEVSEKAAGQLNEWLKKV
jgi:hypothetical protein